MWQISLCKIDTRGKKIPEGQGKFCVYDVEALKLTGVLGGGKWPFQSHRGGAAKFFFMPSRPVAAQTETLSRSLIVLDREQRKQIICTKKRIFELEGSSLRWRYVPSIAACRIYGFTAPSASLNSNRPLSGILQCCKIEVESRAGTLLFYIFLSDTQRTFTHVTLPILWAGIEWTSVDECGCCQCRKLCKEPTMIRMQSIAHQFACSYSRLGLRVPLMPANVTVHCYSTLIAFRVQQAFHKELDSKSK